MTTATRITRLFIQGLAVLWFACIAFFIKEVVQESWLSAICSIYFWGFIALTFVLSFVVGGYEIEMVEVEIDENGNIRQQ